MNKIFLAGRIASDINLKSTQNGKSVTQFSIAETLRMGGTEKTQFHTIVAWEGRAETLSKYCRKGDQLIIEGNVRYREYEKDGQKRYMTEVYVDNFEFGAKKHSTSNNTVETEEDDEFERMVNEEDLPF